jgi:hypothetical protein
MFFLVVDVRDLNGFGFPPTQIGNTEDAKIKSYIITAVYEQKKRER